MSKFSITKTKLSNGIDVVLMPRRESQTVTFQVLLGVGSRYETPKQAGLSHFLEHMFFKGTNKRPSSKQIAEELEALGADFNAFTGEEYTGYYVKIAAKYLQQGAEVVSDILLDPLFEEAEIEKERGVIQEEIKMYTDTPMRHIWHLWNQGLYGSHALGRRIDGTPETVDAFKRKDIAGYARKHYLSGNAVITVAGRFQEKSVMKYLEDMLGVLPQGEATQPKPAPKKRPAQRVVFQSRPSLDQTHIMVGVPGCGLNDKERWTAEVLATILGQGMSSRLFEEVREKRGLAYSIKTYVDMMTDTGAFVTQAGVRTSAAEEAVRAILEQYDLLIKEPVADAELDKAKQMIRGNLLMELEETSALALFAGAQEVLQGKIMTPDEMLEKVEAVTVGDVQAWAQKALQPKLRMVAVLGPQRSARAFEKQLGV